MNETQQMLQEPAVACFTIAGSRDAFGYWTLVVTQRRYGDDDFKRDTYSGLTTGELIDVMEAIDVVT